MTDVGNQFRDAIRRAGLTPPNVIEADGELHRFTSNGKPTDDSGWYVFHGDGIAAGSFGCWRTGLSETWKADICRKLSHVEAAALAERAEHARRQRDAEQARRHAEAASTALARWNAAIPANAAHPYLVRKCVQVHGIRQQGNDLVLPVRDATGALCSLQTIAPDGEKLFLKGGRVKGCYYGIGKPNGTLCVAEGFATGASIREATGHAVAAAFSAGNLEPVAVALRTKLPDVKIIVCADDDYRTEGNPGRTKANAAARAVGGLVAIPDFGDNRPDGATDFNDLAQHAGADAVKRAVANAVVPDVSTRQDDTPNATAGDPDGPFVTLVRGDTVKPEPITWLWSGYIAAGKLHILAGAPGTGKTTLALDFAAAITMAGRWPDGTRAPVGDALIWSGEDAPNDTLAPRLRAAGADMSRVHFVGDVRERGEPVPFDPATHFPALTLAASRLPDLRLMIVDPIVSAVAGDSHHNAEVRRGLQPLVTFAEQQGLALIGITHFTKGTQGREPLERVTGSLGFGAVARIVLGTAKMADEDGGGRVLVRVKSNIGPDGGGFKYELRQVDLTGDLSGIVASRVEWAGPVDGSAREILATAEQDNNGERGELADCRSFLNSLLAGGPVPAKQVYRDAGDAGYSRATLRRAMKALEIDPRKLGMTGGWVWELPKVLKRSEESEGAQPQSVSTFDTFGGNEHLRRMPDSASDPPSVESSDEMGEVF